MYVRGRRDGIKMERKKDRYEGGWEKISSERWVDLKGILAKYFKEEPGQKGISQILR